MLLSHAGESSVDKILFSPCLMLLEAKISLCQDKSFYITFSNMSVFQSKTGSKCLIACELITFYLLIFHGACHLLEVLFSKRVKNNVIKQN